MSRRDAEDLEVCRGESIRGDADRVSLFCLQRFCEHLGYQHRIRGHVEAIRSAAVGESEGAKWGLADGIESDQPDTGIVQPAVQVGGDAEQLHARLRATQLVMESRRVGELARDARTEEPSIGRNKDVDPPPRLVSSQRERCGHRVGHDGRHQDHAGPDRQARDNQYGLPRPPDRFANCQSREQRPAPGDCANCGVNKHEESNEDHVA